MKRNSSKLKVALIHDYLVQYGGAEKTLEAIIELFPEAPIYTGLYDPKHLSEIINNQDIRGPKSGIAAKVQKFLTFLMPFVFENFDLREFDLIISDGTIWPKGVLTTPDQLHISYIHTPPRFLYGYSVESQKRNVWYFRPFVQVIDFFLRIWDQAASKRPDHLLTNSKETQKRIKKFYKREAQVIYPPIELENVAAPQDLEQTKQLGEYFVALGRLSAYKNFDALIKAFNTLDKKLIIIGTGIEEKRLKALAGPNISFEGRATESRKHALLENCMGVINLVQDEDLGIVPIEAMSHGKPVLANKSGGHLETVKEGINGMFFEDLSIQPLANSIREFSENITNGVYNSQTIKDTVKNFSKERFKEEFIELIDTKWGEFVASHQ